MQSFLSFFQGGFIGFMAWLCGLTFSDWRFWVLLVVNAVISEIRINMKKK